MLTQRRPASRRGRRHTISGVRAPKQAETARRAWNVILSHGGVVSRRDIADRWGTTTQRVQALTSRRDFPSPISDGYGAVWLATHVDAWVRTHNSRVDKPGPRAVLLAPILEDEVDHEAAQAAWGVVRGLGGLVGISDLARLWAITDRAARDRAGAAGFPEPVAVGRWLRAEAAPSMA